MTSASFSTRSRTYRTASSATVPTTSRARLWSSWPICVSPPTTNLPLALPRRTWHSCSTRSSTTAASTILWITTAAGSTRSERRIVAAARFGDSYTASREQKYAAALRQLADFILAAYEATAEPAWPWFEDAMTYDNARLPEALIRAGEALGEPRYGQTGLAALGFYESVTMENGVHVPIGDDGWYVRGGRRARYVQQPLEACAMVDDELAAFVATGAARHVSIAEAALEWYYGKNSRGVVMAAGGGCLDGLGEDSVNPNMGAESTLALLSAAYSMAARRARVLRAVR